MIQVIGIPIGSDTAPFFENFFLAQKEAEWVKAQNKLGTINVRKINNSFWFIDDLLSQNNDSTFEKHYKDIYPTELELKKEIIMTLVPLLLICTFTFKMENSILNYLKNEITLASTLQKCHFTAPISLAKCYMRASQQNFLEFLEQLVKLKFFLVHVSSCQVNSCTQN